MNWEKLPKTLIGLDWQWRASEFELHPNILARKIEAIWICQFEHGEHGLIANGRTRLEAAENLMRLFGQKSLRT